MLAARGTAIAEAKIVSVRPVRPGDVIRGVHNPMNEAPVFQVRDSAERKRFEIDLGEGTFAYAEYNLLTSRIMFTHTEVPKAHEGKGLGGALIRAGLAAARERGLKVIPICPFFAAYMQRHAEFHDLLDDVWRRRFGLESTG